MFIEDSGTVCLLFEASPKRYESDVSSRMLAKTKVGQVLRDLHSSLNDLHDGLRSRRIREDKRHLPLMFINGY